MTIAFAVGLALIALGIWAHDLSILNTSEDTLPILVALPLLFWLGSPWNFQKSEKLADEKLAALSVPFFLFGFAFSITLLLAIGWTLLLYSFLKVRIDENKQSSLHKLLVLSLLAFPWIILDLDRLSFWFRISGAYVTAFLFSLFGFDVAQEGTKLLINHLPISVEAACSGMNTLQSMLIAGTALLYLYLPKGNAFWWNLPLLVAVSWLANTLRIILLTTAALLVSPEFALGTFHTFGGWLVIVLMFLACMGLFSLQEKWAKDNA